MTRASIKEQFHRGTIRPIYSEGIFSMKTAGKGAGTIAKASIIQSLGAITNMWPYFIFPRDTKSQKKLYYYRWGGVWAHARLVDLIPFGESN